MQDVICEPGAGEYQGLVGKLPGGQPLDVKVVPGSAVVLLRCASIGALCNDVHGVHVQAGPPAFQFGLRDQQMVRLFQPTQADLNAEAKGRVMIYDGLTGTDSARSANSSTDPDT